MLHSVVKHVFGNECELLKKKPRVLLPPIVSQLHDVEYLLLNLQFKITSDRKINKVV